MSSIFFYIISKWPYMLLGAIIGVALSRYQKYLENKKIAKNESTEN